MPRVLIYEPGDAGHRPVILRYLVKGLPTVGWVPVIYRDSAYAQLRDCDLTAIESEARLQDCDLIHLLTIDGCAHNWLRPRKRLQATKIPIVGTYYLFNNLWGFRGLVWLLAIWFGYIDKILISDPFLEKRWLVPGLRKRIGFIPDPWCRDEFPYIDQNEARNRLRLPLDKKLVLVFGEISQRKGVKRILAALQRVQRNDLVVVFAGTVNADAKEDINHAMSDARISKKLIVHDQHVAEADVSAYFYAADAVLSDYPKWFKVSSGAFTRALAAGRISLVPNHGVNAKTILGISPESCYRTESIESLVFSLDNHDFDFMKINKSLSVLADQRELHCFIDAIRLNYFYADNQR